MKFENGGVPQMPAKDNEVMETKVESGSELMQRARQEVPNEIKARLGCDIAEANPEDAEKIIGSLMNEYVATEGNGMRQHFEVAAELRSWVSVAAKLKKIEEDFGIKAMIANDNNTEQNRVAA